MAKKQSSLANNIDKRKTAGTSRSKAGSTISEESYREMQEGWPRSSRRRRSHNATAGRA